MVGLREDIDVNESVTEGVTLVLFYFVVLSLTQYFEAEVAACVSSLIMCSTGVAPGVVDDHMGNLQGGVLVEE